MKRKILFLVNVDWFFISHRLPIALEALAQGYEVHIATNITDKQDVLSGYGFIVHPLKIGRSSIGIVKEIITFMRILLLFRCVSPNLVHLVTIKPVLYGGIAARLTRIPGVVSAIPGLGFLFVKKATLKARLLRYLVLLLYRLALGHPNQRVILQNSSDQNYLINSAGIPQKKTCLIRGSGVNLAEFSFTPELDTVPVVVMASRLLKDKGVLEFVNAAKLLQTEGIEAKFQLVGKPDPGNPESITKEEMAVWAEEKVVACLGFRSDIAKIFANAHIVVLPSYYLEGLPKVLIEAAAAGRAVITTDKPGCRDAIEPDVSGVLIPAGDAEALANAIALLIKDKALRQRMGKAGRALAKRAFGIERVVAAHLQIYGELIEKL